MGRRLARRRADARAKGAAACTCRMLSERRARSAVGGEKTALWSTLQAGPRKVPVRWQVAVRSPGVAGRLLRRSSPLDAGTHERRGRAHPADERGWAGGSEGKGRRIWIWYMWGVLRSLVHGRRGFACGRPPTGRTRQRRTLHDSPRRTGRASVCRLGRACARVLHGLVDRIGAHTTIRIAHDWRVFIGNDRGSRMRCEEIRV